MKINLIIIAAFCSYNLSVNAQNIGINGTGATPNSSSILDLNTGNTFTSPNGKGFLPPNIALTGATDLTTVASPVTSLLVYNTASAGTGSLAVMPGYYYFNGVMWVAFIGNGSNNWALLGNAGTVDGTNFLGTTDNIPLNFRVNNQKAGKIDHLLGSNFFGYQSGNSNTGSWNSGFGYNALQTNTSGALNTAGGANSLKFNSTGARNTSFGYGTLYTNSTGNDNTAIGTSVLYSNTVGDFNTASGSNSLYSNTIGFQNTAIGAYALNQNTIGDDNVAIGVESLYSNLDGYANVAIGGGSLRLNNSGNNNTSLGHYSLAYNTTGSTNSAGGGGSLGVNTTGFNNTAFGAESLYGNLTGSWNTAIGLSAGSGTINTSGNYNTFLGARSNALINNLTNATAIGYLAIVNASNKIVVGNTAITYIGGQVGWTTISDARYKKEIKDYNVGLNLITKLQPKSYIYNNNDNGIIYQGLLAQDVEKTLTELGVDFSGLSKPQNKDDNYGIRYGDFVIPLINAVKEQQTQIENLTKKVDKITELEKQIAELKQLITK